MAPWRVIARSFPPAPHNPDIALGGLQRPPSPDTRSTEDPGSPALARPEPCASAARIRHTEIPYEQACAAPIISASCSLRRSPADTPDTPAKPESPSTLCPSPVEHSQKRRPAESSTVTSFY